MARTHLLISKEGTNFVIDEPSAPGSPIMGRGRTMLEALGDYIQGNQEKFNISFEVHESAKPAEQRRRQRELAKR